MKNLKFILAACMVLAVTPVHAEDHLVWKMGDDGKQYWYENGQKQGAMGDPKNLTDTLYGLERGREIYDPASDAWYWLDAIYDGAKAESKEVWMPYIFQDDLQTGKNPDGKWVRYDETGAMIKGWYCNENGRYYYDPISGMMTKGDAEIHGKSYHFNEISGVLDGSFYNPCFEQGFPSLASLGINYGSDTDAMMDEQLRYLVDLYKNDGNIDLYAVSDLTKALAVLDLASAYQYMDGGYDARSFMLQGGGTCFGFSDFVYCCCRKLGVYDCWLTIPGRNMDHDGRIYGSQHRTCILNDGLYWYDIDGNYAILTAPYGYVTAEKISADYAAYLIGWQDSFSTFN